MGIGAIPDAVLSCLTNHKKLGTEKFPRNFLCLGIHTEMFSDGVVDLVEKGVITNENKVIHRHQISAGFVMGSKKLYDFIDDNPLVKLYR
jgi:4-hydroxybutyrate CoA-transferase